MTITGPTVHKGLSLFFIHGASRGGTVPLTLQEALAKGTVKIEETGDVNALVIENLGDEDVFVQAGDVVKGGRQDRVLSVSMLLAAKCGKVPIAAFCVEQGRWARRATESMMLFSESSMSFSEETAKAAMMEQARSYDAQTRSYRAETVGAAQGRVWKSVQTAQAKLVRSVGATARAPASPSSLQLSMESTRVRGAKAEYVDKLEAAGRARSDIVGVVFAIDGRVVGGESYPWSGLFGKMWAKNLEARIAEAMGGEGPGGAPLGCEAVAAFMADAEGGARTVSELPVGEVAERRGRTSRMQEALAATGEWVHRSYLPASA